MQQHEEQQWFETIETNATVVAAATSQPGSLGWSSPVAQ